MEYGLTDIQEYYANTGALKKAAENRKKPDPDTGKKKKVAVSIIEAFGGSGDNVPVKDVEGKCSELLHFVSNSSRYIALTTNLLSKFL